MRALAIILGLLLPVLAWGQPALDGHNTGTATSGTTTTISATTAANPEIVIVVGAVRATGTTNPNLTISGCSLSWNQLGTQAQFNNAVPKGTAVNQWYATANSNLSACTITITSDQTIQNSSAAFCSFSGINTTNAFDPNASVTPPGTTSTNSTSSSSTMAVSLSTSLAHSTMVTTHGQTSANMGGITASTGASLCANVTNSGGLNFSNAFISYKTFTTTQSSFSIGLNTSQPFYNVVGTAVTADAPADHSRLIQ